MLFSAYRRVSAILMICAGLSCLSATAQDNEQGEILLSGKQITKLILRGKQEHEFSNPGNIIRLAPDKYTVTLVETGNRFVCTKPGITVQVRPGEQTQLKLGAPLRHPLGVSRLGFALRLDSDGISGRGGEVYDRLAERSGGRAGLNLPAKRFRTGFAVYQGSRKIGGAGFEYG